VNSLRLRGFGVRHASSRGVATRGTRPAAGAGLLLHGTGGQRRLEELLLEDLPTPSSVAGAGRSMFIGPLTGRFSININM
jgi:hypothetical protein